MSQLKGKTTDFVKQLEDYEQEHKPRSLVRSTVYNVNDSSGNAHTVTSWKVLEHAFRGDQDLLPTNARGLFITNDGPSNWRILARGYNKFFNVDEVPSTKWNSIQQNTQGPYTLTVKSNGCIIFIAALDKDHVVVTSKHAVGPHPDQHLSHSQKGQQWLMKILEQSNMSESQLAHDLWVNNWTAVAELCDDSFEEHVLPYSEENSGLYLHGINLNQPDFYSLPMDQVSNFARKYGFHSTKYIVFDTLDQVRAFTDQCAKTGKWENDLIEGFVVRCPLRKQKQEQEQEQQHHLKELFMFKVKFDEPYLMWRQWREITRMMLNAYSKAKDSKDDQKAAEKITETTAAKFTRPETKHYFDFINMTYDRDPKIFDQWAHGRGIFLIRDAYYAWANTPEGEKIRKEGYVSTRAANKFANRPFTKTLIVPIAVPGSGKTHLFRALNHLFGWTHTQSDDIQVKKAAPVFVKNVTNLLQKSTVVMADRNNHLVQHRDQLLGATFNLPKEERVRLVSLVWDTKELPYYMVKKICLDRILNRGENHQTVKVSNQNLCETIVPRFLSQAQTFEPMLNSSDAAFDLSISISLQDDSFTVLKNVCAALCPILGLDVPLDQDLDDALDIASQHRVKSQQIKNPRYYAFSFDINFISHLFTNIIFNKYPDMTTACREFYQTLADKGRIKSTSYPHVTIVHEREIMDEQHEAQQEILSAQEFDQVKGKKRKLWAKTESLSNSMNINDEHEELQHGVQFFIGPKIIWNERVMVLEISGVGSNDMQSFGFLTDPNYAPTSYHLTVGTIDNSVPHYEGLWITRAVNNGLDSLPNSQIGGGKIQTATIDPIPCTKFIKAMR